MKRFNEPPSGALMERKGSPSQLMTGVRTPSWMPRSGTEQTAAEHHSD